MRIQDINFNKQDKYMYCPLSQKLLTIKSLMHNLIYSIENFNSKYWFLLVFDNTVFHIMGIGLSVKSRVIVLKDTLFCYLKNWVDKQGKKWHQVK